VNSASTANILDTDRRELHRDGALVAMQPQGVRPVVHLLKPSRSPSSAGDDLIDFGLGAADPLSDSTLDKPH